MALIRTVSGVRGIVDDDLTDGALYRHVSALAELLPPGAVLLARDSRPHGRRFMAVAAQALTDGNRQICLAGMVPTPTAQFLVTHLRLAGAVVITASHNPVEYNGMKFMGSDGVYLGADQCDILYGRADRIEPPAQIETQKMRGQDFPDGAGEHILNILDLGCIDVEAILRMRCVVVVDAVNGAASVALPTLLEALGCEVVRLNTTPDGTFPRGAEPVAEHLSGLSEAVIASGADLGLATDPDADRLALVDENGAPLGEEYTQAIAVEGFLRRTASKNPVVTNLSSSLLIDKIVQPFGVEVHRSAVGEINVVNLMRSLGADIGGEGNGGVILGESHLGRDALVAAALVLDRLAQDRNPLSALVSSWPKFVMIKEKLAIDAGETEAVLDRLKHKFADVEPDVTDGLKWTWDDRWLHVRRSNTEPVMRLIAEGPDERATRQLIDSARMEAEK